MKKFLMSGILAMFMLVNSVYSQNYTQLYRDFINPEAISSEVKMKEVNAGLKRASEIHPVLVYYYLLKVNNDKRGSDEEKKIRYYYNKLYSSWEMVFGHERESWVEGITNLAEVSYSGLETNKIEDLISRMPDFESFAYAPADTLHPSDSTYYVTWLSINGKYQQYSTSDNYKQLITQDYNKKINKLNEYYNKINPEAIKNEAVEFALSNLVLFTNEMSEFPTCTIPIHEYLHKFLASEFIETENLTVGISWGVLPYKTGDKYSYDYTDYRFPYWEIDNEIELKNDIVLAASIGYKLKLREYKRIFSYVTISGNYVVANSENLTTLKSQNLPLDYKEDISRYFSGNYKLSIENNKLFAFGVLAETPLYYVNKDMYFVGGIELNYYKNTFDAKMEREVYNLISESPVDHQTEKHVTSYSYSELKVLPVVGLNLDYLHPIQLNLRSYNLQHIMFSIIYHPEF